MTKYVGKHRKPPKWAARKTIITTVAVAGFISSSTYAWAGKGKLYDEPPVLPRTVGFATSHQTPVIPKPAPIVDGGREEFENWVDQGMPGYIPDDQPAKGIEPSETVKPLVAVVQATCNRGPASALGLSPNAATVYEAVCALFPEITSFGGLRVGDPQDHGSGNAIDAMIDPVGGDNLSQWLLDHWSELPLKYIIWEQRINDGDGWVLMGDRGGITANHYDHVHISVL